MVAQDVNMEAAGTVSGIRTYHSKGNNITALVIQRLGPGNEPILNLLAANNPDFDIAGRGAPVQPLSAAAAQRYLCNPAVLHWVAFDNDTLVGDLHCIIIPLSSGDECELLLYEIGVKSEWRRRGVGRLLLTTMERWMRENSVSVVWVLADNPAAVDFYRACSFVGDDSQPIYLTRQVDRLGA